MVVVVAIAIVVVVVVVVLYLENADTGAIADFTSGVKLAVLTTKIIIIII